MKENHFFFCKATLTVYYISEPNPDNPNDITTKSESFSANFVMPNPEGNVITDAFLKRATLTGLDAIEEKLKDEGLLKTFFENAHKKTIVLDSFQYFSTSTIEEFLGKEPEPKKDS